MGNAENAVRKSTRVCPERGRGSAWCRMKHWLYTPAPYGFEMLAGVHRLMPAKATEQISALLKNPAFGNSASGGIVALLLVFAINPQLSPFAFADHKHDLDGVANIVAKAVDTESLEAWIRHTNREIDEYIGQIELGLCINPECHFEKSALKRAENRRDDMVRQLSDLRRTRQND